MPTAKEIKTIIERLMIKIPETGLFFYTYDHYKVLGLPSGKNITDKQISEAFETLFWPCYCKSKGLPSSPTLEEVREKLHKDTEASLQQCIEKGNYGSVSLHILLISYYALIDSAQREKYDEWFRFAKWLERLKIIDREKEKLGEYELMSLDLFLQLGRSFPWIVGGLVITLPVLLPAYICGLIVRSSYKAIQSVVSRRSSTGECSSGGEDIQDWELVNVDDCCKKTASQEVKTFKTD